MLLVLCFEAGFALAAFLLASPEYQKPPRKKDFCFVLMTQITLYYFLFLLFLVQDAGREFENYKGV